MFLIDDKGCVRTPVSDIFISKFSSSAHINPTEQQGSHKLVAPNSQVYIIDRNSMKVAERFSTNTQGNLTPVDIYPHIAGKRYIAFILPRGGEAFICNAFNDRGLEIFRVRQLYSICGDRFKVNDILYECEKTRKVITFTKVSLDNFAKTCTVELSVNGERKVERVNTFDELINNDPKLYNLILGDVRNFGELKFIECGWAIYKTRHLNESRYTISYYHDNRADSNMLVLLKSMAPTLNTIDEIERLQLLLKYQPDLCFNDLANGLHAMSMTSLAALSLVSGIHYANMDRLKEMQFSKVPLQTAQQDNILGYYLSNSLTRKAYSLIRKLRINQLKGQSK